MPYQRINWKNGEAGGTPLNETNLNKMDSQIAQNVADIDELKNKPGGAMLVLTNASPLPATDSKPILGIHAKGNSTQNGTPTPTSPIPIVDASTEVTAHTKNLVGELQSGMYDTNGIYTTSSTYICTKNKVNVKPNTKYTISCDTSTQIWVLQYNDDTLLSRGRIATDTIGTFTTLSNANKVHLMLGGSGTVVTESNQIQIEEGTTATSYVPYASNTITLPYTLKSVGNVADELVVNEDGSGKLIRRVGTTTIGALDWRTSSSGVGRFYADIADGSAYTNPICSTYKYSSTAYEEHTISSSKKSSSEDTLRIYVGDTRYTSASEFKSAMSNAVIYYALYTPIETPLTAEEVAAVRQLMTYKGTTIIESEMEIKSVTYPGDVKAYIDGFHTYSTVPTICGYEEDGTPIYQVKIYATTPSTLNGNVVVSDLIKSATHKVKKLDGMIDASPYQNPINMFVSSSYHTSTWVQNEGIMMNISSSLYASKPCEIIVEYTLKDSTPAAASVMSLDETEE